MIVVTITLSTTDHQIKLGFRKLEAARMAVEAIPIDHTCEVRDEFGTIAEFKGSDISHITIHDPAERAIMENLLGLEIIRRDNDFQRKLQQEPDLKYLVGSSNPLFSK